MFVRRSNQDGTMTDVSDQNILSVGLLPHVIKTKINHLQDYFKAKDELGQIFEITEDDFNNAFHRALNLILE